MTEKIIIGLDAKRIVRNGTGLGSYGRTLARDLSAFPDLDIRLYAPDKGRDDLRLQVAEGPNVSYCYPRGWQPVGKNYWRSRGIVRQLRRDGVQLYHGLSGELPMGISRAGIPSVVTIHDLIFMRHPEYYNKVDVKIYTKKFFLALNEADRIVAISKCTQRDICQLGGIDENRVDVVYQSCAQRFDSDPDARKLWQVREHYDLPDRYVLSVGSIEERKNALLAVKALHWLPDDVTLVLVGRPTSYVDQLQDYIDEHRLNPRVMMIHDAPDDDLPAIYRMADAFVYPSRYEGFGIPIIEAIRMGLPVVACTGSCLEEAGGPDSLYADPDDAEGLAQNIRQVLYGAPERQQRIERSRDYVRRFDNNDAAGHFVRIYHELLGLPYGE